MLKWIVSLLVAVALTTSANATMLTTGVGGDAAGGVPATWNPSDKSAAVVLSNGNLTAGCNSCGTAAVRATRGLSAGKAYWEITIVNGASEAGSSWNAGFTDSTTTFATYISNGTLIAVLLVNGNVANGGGNTLGAGVGNGAVLCFAADFTAKKVWIRKDGGNWFNQAIGSQNPATGTGGSPFNLPAAPWYPAMGFSSNNTSVTANFGATAFTQAVPSGFSSFNSLP